MKQKLEVAEVFLKFKRWIENQSSCKIQVIRYDNDTEYTSQRFNSFCEEARIEHQLTVLYSQQQNGVSERKNRIIMEMTRCLLHEKNLPKGTLGRSSKYNSLSTEQTTYKGIGEEDTL